VPLADGRECKLLTGIDDHSRFVVLATVLSTPSAREVAETFAAAMRRYGVPSEVLSDNGGQFAGRFIKPLPVEVLFERICRDNGIKQRLTKPRSPTTTGKIERFHKTLRTEFLDHVAPFESIAAAQEAVDACGCGRGSQSTGVLRRRPGADRADEGRPDPGTAPQRDCVREVLCAQLD
jgi:transposase InsO family protein